MFSITYGQRLVSRSSFVGIFSLKCLQSPSWVFFNLEISPLWRGCDIVQLVLVNVRIYGGDADKSSSWFPHSRHHTFQFDSVLVCMPSALGVFVSLRISRHKQRMGAEGKGGGGWTLHSCSWVLVLLLQQSCLWEEKVTARYTQICLEQWSEEIQRTLRCSFSLQSLLQEVKMKLGETARELVAHN